MPKKGGANKNNSLISNNNSLSLESNAGAPNKTGNNAPEVKVNSNNLVGKVIIRQIMFQPLTIQCPLKKENIQQLLL